MKFKSLVLVGAALGVIGSAQAKETEVKDSGISGVVSEPSAADKAERKKKMLEKFDADKDGKLNEEEKAAMKKEMAGKKGKGKGKKGEGKKKDAE
ncbi:hypothetical protein ACFSSA_13385 [Luteolibacter algae]|uniref:EF-hand domain-containing protein n=1 Tax=Luteolibacter algae TaxID=454151 RepID=A0ABW5DB40_9BACT